mgnify:CR=1 FL=1
MTKTTVITCIAAAVILGSTSGAIAQAPAWAIATWKGTLDAYRTDPAGPNRALIVRADGTCGWGLTEASATAAIQSCTITGDSVGLLTSAGSTIKLQQKNGKLEGTFQTKGGRSYLITMTKQ